MKELFVEKKFGERALKMIDIANSIIDEYVHLGYDLSVRQLYYQFVARNVLKNTPENYQALQTIINEGRLAGMIRWDVIKDRGRVTHTLPTFKDLKTYLQQLNESYRLNKWKAQSNYVEVMVEKQALEGVLLPICEKWEVAFTANKGYSSSSTMYERGKYIQSMRDVEGKDVHVIYLGDHDPSGIDMSRDVQDRLTMFSDGPVTVHRVALNIDQVRRMNLPENPAKMEDSRAKDYVAEFGYHSWELDAINPSTLANMVEHTIRSLINQTEWTKCVRQQDTEQDRLQNIIDSLK
jgi:hypothetical protein